MALSSPHTIRYRYLAARVGEKPGMLSVKGLNRSLRFHTSLQHLHLLRISGQRTVPDRNLRDGTGCDHDAVAVNGSAKRPDELPLMERLAKFQAAQAAGNNVT